MNILITGINGFVAGHVAERLLMNPAHRIWGVARSDALSLPELRDRVQLLSFDLRDTTAVRQALVEVKPDAILHLAAQASVARSFADAVNTTHDNVLPSIALMQYSVELKLNPLLILAGSNEIYGTVPAERMPINEAEPLRPLTPYGVSKAAVDMAAYQWHVSHQLRTIRLRLFSHIGPRQSDAYAVPAFASQIARIEAGVQEPILKVGNLTARRDITDVRDVAAAYEALLTRGVPGAAYNVGSGRSHEIRAILDQLVALSTVPITVDVDPARLRPVDVPDVVCDNRALTNATGWRPSIPLATTLRDMLDGWRHALKEQSA